MEDRKSTRLNSSHLVISYAVFCLKKKITKQGLAWPRRACCGAWHADANFVSCAHGAHHPGRFETDDMECHNYHIPQVFFFIDAATPEIYLLPHHAPLPF